MAAMPAIPAAMILSAMAAMLNKGVFLTFTIPSKIKLWTWELNVQVRADAYLLSRQAAPQDPLHRMYVRGLISHVNGSILIMFLRRYREYIIFAVISQPRSRETRLTGTGHARRTPFIVREHISCSAARRRLRVKKCLACWRKMCWQSLLTPRG